MEHGNPQELSWGRPHALSMFHPLLFLPLGVSAVYLGLTLLSGGFHQTLFAAVGLTALLMTGAGLAISIGRRTVCRWRIEGDVLYFTRGLSRRRELAFRLDRLLYAEMVGNPVYSLFGSARVRLYSSAYHRPFFSVMMAKEEAAALVNRVATGGEPISSPESSTKHMLSGKYAALLGCATSRGTVLPLGAALIFCLFGVFFTRSAAMNLMAAALWFCALIHFLARLAAESKMSVCRTNHGFAIQMGIGGGRRLFVPHGSIVGVIERRSPLAEFCGAARFELLCEGGRRIPCMRWYEGGSGEEAAKRLLDCSGMSCTHAANSGAVRQRYVKLMIAAMFGTVLMWIVTLPITGELRVFCMALAVVGLAAAMVQGMMAIACSREGGIRISSGTLRIGGMGLLSADYLTIRRGHLSAVKIRQGIGEQLVGSCTAELIPKGSRRGVKCRRIPYDKMLAITERFY